VDLSSRRSPVIRIEQGQEKTIGALQVRMSTARADAAIAREI
jgi:hypothetical protein